MNSGCYLLTINGGHPSIARFTNKRINIAISIRNQLFTSPPMDKNAKIYIAGHRGMVGSSIVRALEQRGYNNLILRTSKELDLRNQEATHQFFEEHQILCLLEKQQTS